MRWWEWWWQQLRPNWFREGLESKAVVNDGNRSRLRLPLTLNNPLKRSAVRPQRDAGASSRFLGGVSKHSPEEIRDQAHQTELLQVLLVQLPPHVPCLYSEANQDGGDGYPAV